VQELNTYSITLTSLHSHYQVDGAPCIERETLLHLKVLYNIHSMLNLYLHKNLYTVCTIFCCIHLQFVVCIYDHSQFSHTHNCSQWLFEDTPWHEIIYYGIVHHNQFRRLQSSRKSSIKHIQLLPILVKLWFLSYKIYINIWTSYVSQLLGS